MWVADSMDSMVPPPSLKTPRFPKGPVLACFLVLAGLGALEAQAPGHGGVDAGTESADAGTGAEEPVRVDTHQDGKLAVKAGPPVPLKPEPWMKRGPPCDWEGAREVAIRGACFVRAADAKPPCPARMYEHDGKCFLAVAAAKRPDTSIEE